MYRYRDMCVYIYIYIYIYVCIHTHIHSYTIASDDLGGRSGEWSIWERRFDAVGGVRLVSPLSGLASSPSAGQT